MIGPSWVLKAKGDKTRRGKSGGYQERHIPAHLPHTPNPQPPGPRAVNLSRPTSPAQSVSFVEIPLNKFVYRFRRLSWREELRLKFKPKDDQRRVVLALALHDVSGLVLSPSEATKALQAIPEAVLWRIWVLYRADLPAERYYTEFRILI
jgi:hypothetical protein